MTIALVANWAVQVHLIICSRPMFKVERPTASEGLPNVEEHASQAPGVVTWWRLLEPSVKIKHTFSRAV